MLTRRTPMKRSAWPRRRAGVSPETPVAPAPPVKRLARPANYAPATGHATAVKKDAPARSEAYRRIVAAMPCIHCGIAGYSQHAHANEGKGMGIKTDERAGFPLCAPRPGIEGCHAAFDQYRLLPGGRDATPPPASDGQPGRARPYSKLESGRNACRTGNPIFQPKEPHANE